MNFAYGMILVAALLPYVTVAIAKAGGSGYDNADPRVWAARQTGWRARAMAAHQNHFEAFAPFAAAVIVASAGHGSPGAIDALAASFVLVRVGYTAAYLANTPTLRSALWFVGFLCVLALFGVAI
jgi:uncharacterized MAPEG superfamily protein